MFHTKFFSSFDLSINLLLVKLSPLICRVQIYVKVKNCFIPNFFSSFDLSLNLFLVKLSPLICRVQICLMFSAQVMPQLWSNHTALNSLFIHCCKLIFTKVLIKWPIIFYCPGRLSGPVACSHKSFFSAVMRENRLCQSSERTLWLFHTMGAT